MAVRAVLFDWGGTLTPFHDVDLLDLWRAAARVLAPDGAERLAETLLKVENEAWAETRSTCQSTTTSEILRRSLEQVGLPSQDMLHTTAIEAYLDSWSPHTVARPESAHVLMDVRSHGAATGLLSNTHWPREWHERWLERDGLLHLLAHRVYTCELPYMKPHRSAFEALLNAIEVDPAEAVFVGDREIDDIEGAGAVGMRTVHIPSGQTPAGNAQPTAAIASLSDLPALLETWGY